MEDEMKNLKALPFLVLLFSLYTDNSYTQDTPEFLVDTSIVLTGVYGNQHSPAIAFDGTNYLAVWNDDNSDNGNIRGTFINQSGKVLNKDGFTITNTPNEHSRPDLAFDGTNYLVIWSEDIIDQDIIGTRVSTEGEILDPQGIQIATNPGDQIKPAITFGGEYYFVAWVDVDTSIASGYGTRISTSGNVLDSTGIHICDSIQVWYHTIKPIVVASDDTNYLVAWYKGFDGGCNGYLGSRINQNGELLDTLEIFKFCGGFSWVSVGAASLVFGGDNYFFAELVGGYRSGKIFGSRINTAGTVLDTFLVSGGTTPPAVSYNNDHYLVCYGGGGIPTTEDNAMTTPCIYGSRVSKSGSILDSASIGISENNYCGSKAVISDGTNSLVVWQQGIYADDILGSRVDKYGNDIDQEDIIVTPSPQTQISPSVSSDGDNYFIVWEDNRRQLDFDIYGTRLDHSGINLNPEGIFISSSFGLTGDNFPQVAFGSFYYLTIWYDYDSQLFGARVNQNGILTDSSALYYGHLGHPNPSLASDGDKYLISAGREDLQGLLVDQTGTVINSFAIWQIDETGDPQITFNGNNYLMVWENNTNDLAWDIYGTLVDPDGVVLQPNGIEICINEGDQSNPSTASDGTNYLVVWQDSANSQKNIWGIRVDSTGTLIDTEAFPISLAQSDQEYPMVAYDGNDYIVVWQDNRNGVDYDIYGAKVSIDGSVVDSFVVSEALGDQLAPQITYSSGNQVLVVYSGWTSDYEGKNYDCMRIWGRYLEGVSGVDAQSSELVTEYKLEQCYPNPFNPTTTIQYSVKERSSVEIILYDVLGRQIEVLVKEEQDTGNYTINFNAGQIASGVYLYRLKAGNFIETKKMVLLK
jgi:hypothetical protein